MEIFDLGYGSPFRIGISLFFTIPSPASGNKWSGICGLERLFGRKGLRKIEVEEKKRIKYLIREYLSPDCGVIAFQKNAYEGIRGSQGPEYKQSKAFEGALSTNILIAERSSKFGFPETVFGMFPGMGAFNFLARRLSPSLAKRIINSGKVYSAEELYDMGVVDVLAPDGKGKQAVYEYMQHRQNRHLGFQGVDILADQFNPLTYKELFDVIILWVDTAMQLSEKNIRLMEYMIRAQEKRWVNSEKDNVVTIAS